MQRLCPACFTELTQEANYCPVCGKCMREPVEQSSQYVGGVPVTTVIKMNDCAIHIGVSGIGLEENKYKPYHINIQRGGVSESRYDKDYTGADIFAGRTGESEDRLRAGGNRLRR